jgi:hypothetical protein
MNSTNRTLVLAPDTLNNKLLFVKTTGSVTAGPAGSDALPDAASLAAQRAWYEGVDSRAAVDRFLGERRALGESARGLLGRLPQQVAIHARTRHRPDLAALFERSSSRGPRHAAVVKQALDTLAALPIPQPLIGDEIERWLHTRSAAALRAAGIKTLADLTVRTPRQRRWWATIPGLGVTGARQIEHFFAEHPALTESARSLVAVRVAARPVTVGADRRARGSGRLARYLPGTPRGLRDARRQRLPGRAGLAVAARVASHAAQVPQGGRAPDCDFWVLSRQNPRICLVRHGS